MKIVCGVLTLTWGLLVVLAAPVEDETSSSTSVATSEQPTVEVTERTTPSGLVPSSEKTTDVYDASQNGTDNYRVKIKGFTLLLAPSDALLGAAMMLGGFGDDSLVPPARLNEQPAQRTVQTHSKFSKLLHMLKKFNN